MVGFDVVGHPNNWASLAARLISSYALSDMARGRPARDPARTAHGAGPMSGGQWLREIAAAEVELRPSPGMGEQLVLLGGHVTGGGLWFDDRPAHLAVFPRQSERREMRGWR